MAHTPTPWIQAIGDTVRDGTGRRIADCDNTVASARPCPPHPQDSENAAFIVRACNTHYELVAALAVHEAINPTDTGQSVLAKARGAICSLYS